MGKNKAKFSYPAFVMPVCLVGANVYGKPNFEAIAWFSLVNHQPNLISISSEKSHYTNKGIRENRTFSVNIPSAGMAQVTDYCGLHSGANVDKSNLFDVFYGELRTSPMINECPLNMECKLVQTLELSHGEVFIGDIASIYIEDKYLTEGKPDIKKIDPLLLEGALGDYWKLGQHVAKVFETGKSYRIKPKRKQRM
jgi:flavin reductase (DIM6/NTAB) family NADH-FMN oxidoreductase RutF